MWLFSSSIGKKLIMSLSGIFLVLFLTFHMSMNLVAAISAKGYNLICEFLGANWYALAGTAVLALGAVVHIVYAFVLTVQNRNARGADRYAVQEKPATVEWASQNMLVLGLIILGGLVLHLSHFWFNMQLQELLGNHTGVVGSGIATVDGAAFIQYFFHESPLHWLWVALYLVWFGAIWFHLTHGVWSAFQTLGWNNLVWIERWRTIAYVVATLIVLGFAIVAVGYALDVFPLGGTCEAACCQGA